jgi:hypothetical protein
MQAQTVEKIKNGEYVRRTESTQKTYIRDGYDSSSKRYTLTDCDDINRTITVKKGTSLFTGFTY